MQWFIATIIWYQNKIQNKIWNIEVNLLLVSDGQIRDIAAVLDTHSCHRIATQSYSTAIISIHRHWVQRSSLIKQLRIVVTGQDSSRSNKVAGPVIRGFINVIFVQHTEYTRKIIVMRAHNALIDVGMMMWNIADWMQSHSIYSITTRHIFLNEFGHNLFTVSHDLKYGNMSNVKL